MVRKYTKKENEERLIYPVSIKFNLHDYTALLDYVDRHRVGYTLSQFVREIIMGVVETGKYDIRDGNL